ncbi:MAG: hypothetical protein P8R42_05660 [Candidatus Binatia bacterium]|nr:hypothetical protein [Candidatus Binatia bacterium]
MKTLLPIIAGALLLAFAPPALAEGPIQKFHQDLEGASRSDAWQKHLPFFGNEFRERGLFPPFGLSFVTSAFEQDVLVDNITIGRQSFGEDLRVPTSPQKTLDLFLRADVFVLPFLSVYGLAGYSKIESTTLIVARPFQIDSSVRSEFEGSLCGAGGAIPLRYENHFLFFDVAVTFADTGARS